MPKPMLKAIAGALTAASLAACQGETPPRDPAVPDKEATDDAIGTFTTPDLQAYCTFLRDGYDPGSAGPSEIEFLFVTLFDDADNRARMSLDGETRTMVPVDAGDAYSVIETGRSVTYTVEGLAGRTVSALVTKTGEAPEQTEYDIEITDDATGETARGSGGCGV